MKQGGNTHIQQQKQEPSRYIKTHTSTKQTTTKGKMQLFIFDFFFLDKPFPYLS